jgi:hypothetical protein
MVPFVYGTAYATNGSTTDLSTFADIPGTTLTLPSAGIYEIYYIMNSKNTDVSANTTFIITDSANNLISGSAGSVKETTGTTLGLATTAKVILPVTASRTLKVRWKTTDGTTTLVNNSLVANSVFGYEKRQ